MKYLVETTGAFALQDLMGRQTVQAFRPTVVERTPFIDSLRGEKLNVLEVLADDAEDTALAEAPSREALQAAIDALPRPTKAAPKDAAKAEAKPDKKGK